MENIAIGRIIFSEHLFALVRDFNIYTTYLIGLNSFEMNTAERNKDVNKVDETISYFTPVSSESECKFSNFGITARSKENSETIVPNYECVIDELQEIYKDEKVTGNNYYYFEKDSYPYPSKKTGPYCAGYNQYNCTCNFRNKNMRIFLGNVSNHYCKDFIYINFAKAEDIRIPNIKPGGRQFTLHFWVFAYSYIDKVFRGINVEWKRFVTIEVRLDSTGSYYFTCLRNGKETGKSLPFVLNEWVFLHCSFNTITTKSMPT